MFHLQTNTAHTFIARVGVTRHVLHTHMSSFPKYTRLKYHYCKPEILSDMGTAIALCDSASDTTGRSLKSSATLACCHRVRRPSCQQNSAGANSAWMQRTKAQPFRANVGDQWSKRAMHMKYCHCCATSTSLQTHHANTKRGTHPCKLVCCL